MRDYRISIKDILDAMDKIEQFTCSGTLSCD